MVIWKYTVPNNNLTQHPKESLHFSLSIIQVFWSYQAIAGFVHPSSYSEEVLLFGNSVIYVYQLPDA